jgi:acetyl-CoA synthetase
LLESSSSLISRTLTADRIETLLDEQRRFTPPDSFKAQAHVRDTTPHERARRDPEGYWADGAKQLERMSAG